MAKPNPLHALRDIHRHFGPEAAREKRRLLQEIVELRRVALRDLPLLQDVLDFMRAYPDDERVRQLVGRAIGRLREWVTPKRDSPALLDRGLPGGINRYPYSYAVLQQLHRRHPGSVEVDWSEYEDQSVLGAVLDLLFTAPENEAAEYLPFGWDEWIRRTRANPSESDLGFLLAAFERSGLPPLQQAGLFELCGLPIRYQLTTPGTGRAEVALEPAAIQLQKQELPRERFSVESEIEKPLSIPRVLSKKKAELVLDTCLRALCARELEIHPLIYASADDVLLFSFERGIQIVLAGVLPEHRAPLGASYFFLVLKNGAPIAYGPTAPLFGACELGINLFPQFRGGEIRYVYAQFMRVLHHMLGVELFYLTRYGMGEDNPDAIASGAFWFYRKLAFSPTNPEVEALARDEEARMKRSPGYRSDRRMLHRLSHTEAVMDLSNGRRRPFEFGELGLRVSRAIAEQHGGDRPRAVRHWSARAQRQLEIQDFDRWTSDERAALDAMSPILALIEDLSTWPHGDRSSLVQIIRGKAARSEARVTRAMAAHPRFEPALRTLVSRS